MSPVDVEKAQKLADDIISSAPSGDIEEGDFCDGYYHCPKCDMSVDYYFDSPQCIMDEVEAARQQKRKLGMLHKLKDCIQDPLTANGLRVLEGMAQKSCIYELEYVRWLLSVGMILTLFWQT